MRDLSVVSAAGYLRVSTERQAGEVQTSLADQERAIVALAGRLGATVGEWFRDEGASGATVEKRPAFCSLLQSCEAHKRPRGSPGLVLVLNDSRFGRFENPEESTYWRVHLQRLGWIVRFAEGDDVEDVMGRGVLRFVASAQASQYRQAIVANARRGARGAAELGFWTREAPIGFRRRVVYPPERTRLLERGALKAPDEKVVLAPEETVEAPIVRAMFERYSSGGHSLETLATWLRETIPNRGAWSRASVASILKNPAYVGDVVGGRRKEGTNIVSEPTIGTYGKRDAHPAIVSRELFAAVQDRLATHRRMLRSSRGKYVLSGLVTCTHCGLPYVGGGLGGQHKPTKTRTSGGIWFYKCSDGIKQPPYRGKCTGRVGTVSKTKLETAVIGKIGDELSRPSAIIAINREIDRVLRERPGTLTAHLDRATRERVAAERRRDRLVGLVADGTLVPSEAAGQLSAAREEIARLTATETKLRFQGLGDGGIDETARQRIAELAKNFAAVADQVEGLALRELIRPWLASATFDKETRVLTLGIRRIPALGSLLLSDLPGPDRRQQRVSGVVYREVSLMPTAWAKARARKAR